MEEKKLMKRSDDVVTREIEGKVVLMPLHKTSKDLNYIYTLNETASHAWNLFDGKSTLDDIRNSLAGKYDVTEARLKKELDEFVKDLKSIKAVL